MLKKGKMVHFLAQNKNKVGYIHVYWARLYFRLGNNIEQSEADAMTRNALLLGCSRKAKVVHFLSQGKNKASSAAPDTPAAALAEEALAVLTKCPRKNPLLSPLCSVV